MARAGRPTARRVRPRAPIPQWPPKSCDCRPTSGVCITSSDCCFYDKGATCLHGQCTAYCGGPGTQCATNANCCDGNCVIDTKGQPGVCDCGNAGTSCLDGTPCCSPLICFQGSCQP